MKIKNKFLMGALLTAASLGVVGSITGTYAWFSYNTKATASYNGVVTGKSRNLQVKLAGDYDWSSNISIADMLDASEDRNCARTDLEPVSFKTTQKADKSLETLYGHFSAGNPNYSELGTTKPYFQVQLEFRYVDYSQGTSNPTFLEKDIFISDLTYVVSDDDGRDVSEALRVHLGQGTEYNTLIAPGYDTDSNVVTNLYGTLDLDNDGVADTGYFENDVYIRRNYDFDDPSNVKTLTYGVDGVTETAYSKKNALSTFSNGSITKEGVKVCRTNTSGATSVNLTIYLQGWEADCIADNIGATFDFGITFECEE